MVNTLGLLNWIFPDLERNPRDGCCRLKCFLADPVWRLRLTAQRMASSAITVPGLNVSYLHRSEPMSPTVCGQLLPTCLDSVLWQAIFSKNPEALVSVCSSAQWVCIPDFNLGLPLVECAFPWMFMHQNKRLTIVLAINCASDASKGTWTRGLVVSTTNKLLSGSYYGGVKRCVQHFLRGSLYRRFVKNPRGLHLPTDGFLS